MPARTLPPNPNLAQLKLQATELKSLFQRNDPAALARISAHHPGFAAGQSLKLSDFQRVIAREYGFDSWATLKHFTEWSVEVSKFKSHPHFGDALQALDAGDIASLTRLLSSYPDLTRARTNLEPPYNYFTCATLLHHVAGNPNRNDGRKEMLPNVVACARVLLEGGSEVEARTLGPNGGTTMGLLLTSAQASQANVSGTLIDLLLEFGASIDIRSPECLHASAINHAPRAAEKLIELGATPDLFVAASIGNMQLLRECFDEHGKVVRKPTRNGKPLSQRDSIGLALLGAYVRGQREAVDSLIELDGNWNMTGVNNGTALHRAANADDLDMVKRLVAKGADISDRNNPFTATPLSWAAHFEIERVVEWFRANCPIDIHDAACFDFPEHVQARLREHPEAANQRCDQWDIPKATPLHCAALKDRREIAKLLLAHGADPTLRAGNGLTPLEEALRAGSTEVAHLLEQPPRSNYF